MKKVLFFTILLSINLLSACGDDSSNSPALDECTEHPDLCEINNDNLMDE